MNSIGDSGNNLINIAWKYCWANKNFAAQKNMSWNLLKLFKVAN